MKGLLLGTTLLSAGGSIAADAVGVMEVEFDMDLISRQATGQLLQSNLQTFTGALGGATAAPITSSGDSTRPFEVSGNTFTDFQSAAERSCDDQMNACAQIANDGNSSSTFTVADCNDQDSQCKAAAATATVTTFATLTSQNADFDFFCE